MCGSGALAYAPLSFSSSSQTLVWVDRAGQEEPAGLGPGSYRVPRLSPDDLRLVYDDCCEETTPPRGDIWMYGFDTGNKLRLTLDPIGEFHPQWSRDGEHVAFYSYGRSLDRKLATGSGNSERLVSSEGRHAAPVSFDPDDESLLFTDGARLWLVEVGTQQAQPLLPDDTARQDGAEISPDGTWLLYSAEGPSGKTEVFLRPFPDVAADPRQLSADGGSEPAFSRDGGELYYRRGDQMIAHAIDTATFELGPPRVLFEGRYDVHMGRNYDVSLDGRFLMVKTVTEGEAPRSDHIVLVQNWAEELKERVPVD